LKPASNYFVPTAKIALLFLSALVADKDKHILVLIPPATHANIE